MIEYSSWTMVGIVGGVAALLAGAVLGVFFFAGLWWTVRRGASSPTPARWFLGSMVLRTSIVLAGFYFVGGGQALRLGLCMLGFLLARVIVLRATRTRPATAAATVAPAALNISGDPPCA